MPIRRRRRHFARSSRRGRGRRLRIGRARTSVVKTVFECENVQAYQIQPGGSTLVNQQQYYGYLPGFYLASSNYNAVTYAFTFPLAFLATYGTNNYNAVQKLYDYVKLSKIRVQFTPSVDPKNTYTIAVPSSVASQNLATVPGQDPVITWFEYDGWSPMPNISATSVVVAPANGDMTSYVYNKRGARKHSPWRKIKRTFVPRIINLIANDGSAPGLTANTMVGKRAGYMSVGNSSPWFGQMMMAVPYLGADTSPTSVGVNYQPQFNWAILTRWYMHFKVPLYG